MQRVNQYNMLDVASQKLSQRVSNEGCVATNSIRSNAYQVSLPLAIGLAPLFANLQDHIRYILIVVQTLIECLRTKCHSFHR